MKINWKKAQVMVFGNATAKMDIQVGDVKLKVTSSFVLLCKASKTCVADYH